MRRLVVHLAVFAMTLACGAPLPKAPATEDGAVQHDPKKPERRKKKDGRSRGGRGGGKKDGMRSPPPNDAGPKPPLDFAGVQFGTAKDDTAFMVATWNDKVFVVGTTDDRVDKACDPDTDEQAFIQAFSVSNSNRLWGDHFGTSGSDVIRVVTADASGVYLVGRTSGSLDGTATTDMGDIFLRKYSHDGELLAKKQFGTGKMDEPLDLVLFGNEVYLSGGTNGNLCLALGVAGGEACKHGMEDAFVAKFDQDLELLGMRQFGSVEFEEGLGVAVDDRWVYVTGATGGLLGERQFGRTDAFVTRLTRDLVVDETIQFGSDGVDFARGLVVWKGDVFVTGRTEGQLTSETTAFGASDGFLYRAPFDGKKVIATQWGGPMFDGGNRVRADRSGLYVAVVSNGSGKHDCTPADGGGQVRMYSHDLDLRWATDLGTPQVEDDVIAVALASDDIFVVGRTRGVMGDRNLGGYDAFLRRVDRKTGALRR